jgi:hypothetical protein
MTTSSAFTIEPAREENLEAVAALYRDWVAEGTESGQFSQKVDDTFPLRICTLCRLSARGALGQLCCALLLRRVSAVASTMSQCIRPVTSGNV